MEKQETGFAGCFEIQGDVFKDVRGVFLKTYQEQLFIDLGLRKDWREEYYSISRKNVIRGMHFQMQGWWFFFLLYCKNIEEQP